jgi:hypothetical protein
MGSIFLQDKGRKKKKKKKKEKKEKKSGKPLTQSGPMPLSVRQLAKGPRSWRLWFTPMSVNVTVRAVPWQQLCHNCCAVAGQRLLVSCRDLVHMRCRLVAELVREEDGAHT